MLLPLLVTFTLFAIGAAIVAKVAHYTLERLKLDPMNVALWLGLADDHEPHLVPVGGRRKGRPRLAQPNDGTTSAGAGWL